MMEEVSRVRLSMNSRIEQLEKDCRSNRISTLEKELSGLLVIHCCAHFKLLAYCYTVYPVIGKSQLKSC